MLGTGNSPECRFVRDHLFSYIEKDLTKDEIMRFEDHVHSCDGCSPILSSFLSLAAVIDSRKAKDPGPFTGTRTLQRIESVMEAEAVDPHPLFHRLLRPVSVSFLVILAMILGFSLTRLRESGISSAGKHQVVIQAMKSELNVTDFIDEDKLIIENH